MTDTTIAAEPKARPAIKIRPLTENRFISDGTATKRNRWFATAEENTPFQSMLDPAYWAHVAYRIREYDLITVAVDDEAWYGELLVRSVGPQSVGVVVLSLVKLGEDTPEIFTDHYQVNWGGPQLKFRVIRLSDRAAVRDGFKTRQEANAWLHENAKTLLS